MFVVGAPTAAATLLNRATEVPVGNNKSLKVPYVLADGSGVNFVDEASLL
jgi:hypothetical protein